MARRIGREGRDCDASDCASVGDKTGLAPWSLGVCSWSLQVRSIAELKGLLDQLGINVVQIACGDPHHASWEEGDAMPAAALASGIVMTGAMLGFPGEDYTTPQTIKETGGFGNPATRAERLERLGWALERTMALGLTDLTLHAGFLPEPDDPGRSAMLDTLAEAGQLAAEARGHPGLRDRPGDRRSAPPDAGRPEGAQPQGQFRPGQHAALRHGRPDPRRRDPRPGHPLGAREGRTAAPRSPASGAKKCRWARARSTSGGSSRRSKSVGYAGPLVDRARGRRPGRPAPGRRAGAGTTPRVAGADAE